MNKALIIVALTISIGKAGAQSLRYFSKCIRAELITNVYQFAYDSTVRSCEYAEQWKSPAKEAGSWRYDLNSIEWTGNDHISVIFQIDTIMSLRYLIATETATDLTSIKEEIRDCIKRDATYQELSGFEMVAKDSAEREQMYQNIQYPVAMKCVCGKKVLVEIPERYINQRDFEYYRDRQGKKKDKSKGKIDRKIRLND